MIPLALALVVGVAPAAFAKQHLAQAAGTQQQRQNQKMTGMQQMLPGGLSFKGQLDHAYSEAANVQAALAMDMEDMAKNHLSNVKLILAHLEQSGVNLDKPMTDRLNAIRSEADRLDGMMGDRNAALKGSSTLVSRFVTFYDQMASAMPMGGGGAMARPMKSATELLASAGDSAVMAQSALAGRDFVTASNHARDLQQHLTMTERAMMTAHGMKAQSTEVKHVKALQQDARKLMSSIDSRSANATKQAGQMVDRIGSELTLVANATMGGGGGMTHPEHR
ncbi:hypothetical protein D3C86_1523180 [compost metagenome]